LKRLPTLEMLETFPILRYVTPMQDGLNRGWTAQALRECCSAQPLTADLLNTPVRCLGKQALARLVEGQEPDHYSVAVLVHWAQVDPPADLSTEIFEDRVGMVVGDGVLNVVRSEQCVVYAIYVMTLYMGEGNRSGRPASLQAASIHHAPDHADLLPLIQAWDEERKRRPAA
jgi:hypothetical protein